MPIRTQNSLPAKSILENEIYSLWMKTGRFIRISARCRYAF